MPRKKTCGRSTPHPRPTRNSSRPQVSADVRGSAGHQGRRHTARQARFVKEYLVDLNGTQAAIRAGYSAHTANKQSTRLLTNADIKAAVDAGAAKQHAQLDLTAQKVLTELLGVGYATVKATDVRVSDKLRALELLAKHLGLLTEQVDHKHSGRFELVWAEDE